MHTPYPMIRCKGSISVFGKTSTLRAGIAELRAQGCQVEHVDLPTGKHSEAQYCGRVIHYTVDMPADLSAPAEVDLPAIRAHYAMLDAAFGAATVTVNQFCEA